MRAGLKHARLVVAILVIGVATVAIAAVAFAAVVPAQSSDERTIDASITNGTKGDLTVYAKVNDGTVTSQTGKTPFLLRPGQTFDFQTAGPEDDPCEFDNAETCLESMMFVDIGNNVGSPTTGFKKAAQNIKPFNTTGVAVPGKEGGDPGRIALGNGEFDFTFYAWNPRGEVNQTCVDNPQGWDVSEVDSGIAVLDFAVQWTITPDFAYGPAYDGC